jgi:hypothetical protein
MHLNTHTNAPKHVYTHTHTFKHTNKRTRTCMYTQPDIQTHIQTHTNMYTHIHLYIDAIHVHHRNWYNAHTFQMLPSRLRHRQCPNGSTHTLFKCFHTFSSKALLFSQSRNENENQNKFEYLHNKTPHHAHGEKICWVLSWLFFCCLGTSATFLSTLSSCSSSSIVRDFCFATGTSWPLPFF